MNNVKVKVKTLPHYEGLPLPEYHTEEAACLDILAAVTEPVVLQHLERKLIPTGLCIALPKGYQLRMRSRSGNPIKTGFIIANGSGTIDSDYRGEMLVGIINLNKEPITIERGFKIAQAAVEPVYHIQWEKVSELDETARGAGGFGSTGTKVA
jgi:dUTP pyrophosphatase